MEINLRISLDVKEAAKLITEKVKATLVSTKQYQLDDKTIIILVFNHYFSATRNETALIVTLDNVYHSNKVSIVSTSGGDGLLRLDWGASKILVDQVTKILKDYTIEQKQYDEPIDEFETLYFTNSEQFTLHQDYQDFLQKNKDIEIIDQFEDSFKDDDNSMVYTLFITYTKQ